MCCHVSPIFRWSYLRMCGPHLPHAVSIDWWDGSWSPLISIPNYDSWPSLIVDHPSGHDRCRPLITLYIVITTDCRSPSLIAIILILDYRPWPLTTVHDRDHPDTLLPSLTVDHPLDLNYYRTPTTILDRYHAWSRVLFSILTTLCVLDLGILKIDLNILTIDLVNLTIDLGIVIFDLGIVIIDLRVAQLNSQLIPLHDLS